MNSKCIEFIIKFKKQLFQLPQRGKLFFTAACPATNHNEHKSFHCMYRIPNFY